MEVIENIAFIEISTDMPDAPGRRGTFTAEDVLDIFNANLMDPDLARIWVLKRLHPAGAHCPGCAAAIPDDKLWRFWSNERMSCRNCGKYFTALTGTFMSGCQMDFREVLLMAFLIALGIGDRRIAAIIRMSPENVRLWRMKFNAHTRLASKEDS